MNLTKKCTFEEKILFLEYMTIVIIYVDNNSFILFELYNLLKI